jgi:hypothetical protein
MRLARFAGRCFVTIALLTPLAAAAQFTSPAVYENPNIVSPQVMASATSTSPAHPGFANIPSAQPVRPQTKVTELPAFIAQQKLLQNRAVRGMISTLGGGDVLPGRTKPQLLTVEPSVDLGHHGGFSVHVTINLDRRDHSTPQPQR